MSDLRLDQRVGGKRSGSALCTPFLESLPVTGAWISVVSQAGAHCVVEATDAAAARLESAQFELGVGPVWQALGGGRFSSLDVETGPISPVAAIVTAGVDDVRALFGIPLLVGTRTVGVVGLYSCSADAPWSDQAADVAGGLAADAAVPAVRLAARSAAAPSSRVGGPAPELRREVHQAVGMVMAQLGCDADTAMLRLRARSFATTMSLEATAQDVIARRWECTAS